MKKTLALAIFAFALLAMPVVSLYSFMGGSIVIAATAATSAVGAATMNVHPLSEDHAYVQQKWVSDASGDFRYRVKGRWTCAFTRLHAATYTTGSLQASASFDFEVFEIVKAELPVGTTDLVVEYDLLLTSGTNLSNSVEVNIVELRDQDGDVRFSSTGDWLVVGSNCGNAKEGWFRLDFDLE